LLREAFEVGQDRCRVERHADTQRTPEGPTTDGLLEAAERGMQRGAAALSSTRRIRKEGLCPTRACSDDHSQECRPAIPL